MKLCNGGAVGLGRSKNVTVRHFKLFFAATALSLVSCSRFLLWKDLQRNLDYHLCQVRNMWTKHFYYFQGLRVLTIGWDDPCRRLFQVQCPPPPGFPGSLTPLPMRISRIPTIVGVWIFFRTSLSQKNWAGLWPIWLNPYSICEQNLQFCLPYL